MNDRRKRILAAERARRSPPPGAEARVLAALEARLGGPSDPGSSEGGDGSGPGSGPGGVGSGLAHTVKIIIATTALTIGGLGLVRMGAVVLQSARRGAPTSEAPRPRPPELAVEDIAPIPVTPAAVPAPEMPARATSDERGPITSARRSRSARAEDKPTSTNEGIAAELALIERARRERTPALTIAVLEQHARSFPSGSFTDERDALWSLASCELGGIDEARTHAKKLAERSPSSPLLERIASACPTLVPDLRLSE